MHGLRMADKVVATFKDHPGVSAEVVEKALRSLAVMTRGDAIMDAIEVIGGKYPGAALLLLEVTRNEMETAYAAAGVPVSP